VESASGFGTATAAAKMVKQRRRYFLDWYYLAIAGKVADQFIVQHGTPQPANVARARGTLPATVIQETSLDSMNIRFVRFS